MLKGPMPTDDQPADITAFLTDLARQDRSAQTWTAYRSDLLQFARWFATTTGDPFRAANLTRIDVRDYKQHLLTVEGRTPATVNRRLAALRAFGTWAKGKRLLTDLPTEGVRDVPRPRQAPKALERREVDRLLRAAEKRGKARDRAILLTLRHTGLRVAELCALSVGDIDLSDRKGQLVVRSGKGQKQRRLPLNVDVRKALAQYLATRPGAGREEPLFLSQKGGKRLSTKAVRDLVRTYAYHATLDAVSPHTLRHSFAKHLLDAGEALPTVAAALGHENLNTTALYTQPSARDLERAVSRLAWEEEP